MLAEKYEEDGTKVSAEVQTKGYVSTDYKVSTQYQVTLYRWNMAVRGSPGTMTWDFTLENADREEQNAYHEYFIVMQVDEGEAFTIDNEMMTPSLKVRRHKVMEKYGEALEGLYA